MKIGGVKRVVFRAKIKFCPRILHFSSEHKFHETWHRESHTLFRGVNEFKSIPTTSIVPFPITGLKEQRITLKFCTTISMTGGDRSSAAV